MKLHLPLQNYMQQLYMFFFPVNMKPEKFHCVFLLCNSVYSLISYFVIFPSLLFLFLKCKSTIFEFSDKCSHEISTISVEFGSYLCGDCNHKIYDLTSCTSSCPSIPSNLPCLADQLLYFCSSGLLVFQRRLKCLFKPHFLLASHV